MHCGLSIGGPTITPRRTVQVVLGTVLAIISFGCLAVGSFLIRQLVRRGFSMPMVLVVVLLLSFAAVSGYGAFRAARARA